jgi:hypothetical protein
MSQQTATTTATLIPSKIMELPVFKSFDQTQIVSNGGELKPGAKGIFWFLKLALIGAVGYLTWVYVLPPLFQALGQMLAVVGTGILCVFLIMIAPAIFKWLKNLAKNIHKGVIRQAPFEEFARQKQKMLQNRDLFRLGKAKIKNLENDMMVESKKSEDDAHNLQKEIIRLQTKTSTLNEQLKQMVEQGGVEARNSDEYVNGRAELAKMLADAERISHRLSQSKDYIQKYGSRAAVMKKLNQKLIMVEASMDIKIEDFNATVEMLKKDFEFAQKSKEATNAAKSAMMFDKSWELDYAMEVVMSTISNDIATTSGNIRDIDSLATNYNLDNDDLYNNLNTLADSIKIGTDIIPTSKQYNNIDYKFTTQDKLKSGGLSDIF